MRYIALLLTLSAGLFADDASKAIKVDELLKVMNVQATIDQVYGQMAKQIDSTTGAVAKQYNIPPSQQPDMAEMSKSLMVILSDQLSWEKMKPVYEKIYGEVFDENEIDGLLVFYRSPVGQSFVTKTPLVMQKSGEAMQARLPELMAAMQKATQDFVHEHHLQKP
jgi:uncharacterized protein